MAKIDPIEVGIKIVDPNWAVMFTALTSHAMRALGHLEADRPDLALAELKKAESVGDLAMMVKCDVPPLDLKDVHY
jgi:hypothetical protein